MTDTTAEVPSVDEWLDQVTVTAFQVEASAALLAQLDRLAVDPLPFDPAGQPRQRRPRGFRALARRRAADADAAEMIAEALENHR